MSPSSSSTGDIETFLKGREAQELVHIFTCGNVDDGKSSLIGRLLYDAKLLPTDVIAAVERDSVRFGTTGGFDPALVLDGLQAEREQGITIDVAYRYFATERRSFIVADTPGHEQYTRNMATGASTADLAIILVDARNGMREQTKRHAFIASLLGIRHIIVAVNKMDLVDYREDLYEEIKRDFTSFASRLDVKDLHLIPLSALKGDNVVEQSKSMPWYRGATLLYTLETVHIASDRNMIDVRFPVQYVSRPNAKYRGYAGTIASGVLRVGDEVLILPSKQRSTIAGIDTFNGEMKEAFAPMAVTLRLKDERDVSRGDMICAPKNVPHFDASLEAMIVWMAEEPMDVQKEYVFKHATKQLQGKIDVLRYAMDVNTLHRTEKDHLVLNDIGRCSVILNQPIAFDAYERNRTTGAFIIIDRLTNATLGAGMILDRRVEGESEENAPQDKRKAKDLRAALRDLLQASDLSEDERIDRILALLTR